MNKNYFKFLISSNKVLYAFIALTEVILTAISPITTNNAQSVVYKVWFVAIIAAFALPVLSFYHALNKKAVDSYFALPLRRKELAITTIVTNLLVIAIPTVAILVFLFTYIKLWSIYSLSLILFTIVMIITLLVFNSGVYLIANNFIDGAVILGAYHFFPVLLALLESAINGVVYYGYYGINRITDHLSYLVTSFELMDDYCCQVFRSNCEITYVPFIVMSIVYLFIGLISIKNNYINRKTERADAISDRISAYPFIIYTFATILLISVTFSDYYSNQTFISILSSHLLSYVFIIIAFIIGTFIYKRKLTISLKSIIYLMSVCFVSICCLRITYSTEGFKKSYEYDHSPKNMYVSVSRYVYDVIEENVKDQKYSNGIDLYADIEIDATNPKYNEFVDYINNIRDNSIRDHFQFKEVDYSSYLSITQNFTRNSEYYYIQGGENFGYNNVSISFEDFKYLSEFGEVRVSYYNEITDEFKEYSFQEFMETNKGAATYGK